jgi:Primase C terminal 2 (PriCT-2)
LVESIVSCLWEEWSRKSEKYQEEDTLRVWHSFRPERTGYQAVFAEAQRQGWTNSSTVRAKGYERFIEGLKRQESADHNESSGAEAPSQKPTRKAPTREKYPSKFNKALNGAAG